MHEVLHRPSKMLLVPSILHRRENGPARLRGDVVSSALLGSLPLRAHNLPAWPVPSRQACRQLGWWSEQAYAKGYFVGKFQKKCISTSF